MTQKEKSEAYDEALERARKLYNSEETSADVEIACETIFPELAESEDEKVKRILHSISNKISFHLHDIFTEEEFQCFDAWSNAWLEKQGEEKSADKEELASSEKVSKNDTLYDLLSKIPSEHCPTCGVVLYDGSNYCHKCGTPVSEVAIKLENAKKGGEHE